MSRRPGGPSDRPVFYHDLEGHDHPDAPRLPSQGIVSRVCLGSLVLCCCGLVAMCFLFVMSLFAQIPRAPTAAAVGPGASIYSIEPRNIGPVIPALRKRQRHHAQRSVLHRLAMLERAHPPAKGVDEASVAMVFPHWVGADGWDTSSVLRDIVLAMSYLAQEEEDD